MRRLLVLGSSALLFAGAAAAQDAYPVSVGVGGGLTGNSAHALFVVGIKPARSPVALRLDGMWRERHPNTLNNDLLSAVSASALITLRPWAVSPYLIVGATRRSEFVLYLPITAQYHAVPATTQLTGGFGLEARIPRGKLFAEARDLRDSGTAFSFGISF